MTNLAGDLVAIRVPLGGRLQAPGASLSQQQQLTHTQQLSNTGLIFVSWVAAHFLPPITLMVTIQLGREGVYSGAAPPSSLPQREVQVEVKQV